MSIVERLVDVTGVEVVGAYRLRLAFADGTVGDVDFKGRREPLDNEARRHRADAPRTAA